MSQNAQEPSRVQAFSRLRLSRLSKFDCTTVDEREIGERTEIYASFLSSFYLNSSQDTHLSQKYKPASKEGAGLNLDLRLSFGRRVLNLY
jgi:hypothetical protein